MRKSEQYSVAIFFAVALFAGAIAGSSAPAFVVDAQATEEKRHSDKNYRHDDNGNRDGRDGHDGNRDGRDGHDGNRDGRDGHDGDRDGRDGHDGDKSSVKYIKCNNVNINGKGGHSGGNDWQRDGGHDWQRDGGHDWQRDGGNDWPRDGGHDWPRDGGNEWPRGGDNHNFPGFIKQTDKDVVVICIFNNDKKDKEPQTPEDKCAECISNLPGRSPNPMQENGTGLERDFIEFLIDTLSVEGEEPLTAEEAIAEFCELLTTGEISEELLLEIIDDALPPTPNSNPAEELFDCLSALIPEGPPEI